MLDNDDMQRVSEYELHIRRSRVFLRFFRDFPAERAQVAACSARRPNLPYPMPCSAWLQSDVGANFVLVNDERCNGEITWTSLKAAQRIPLKRLSGWAVDMEQHKPLDWILITDADLIVRGLGVSALHDAELGGIPLPDIDFPWTGFLHLSIGRLPFQAFGVLDDALVCNLNLPTIRDRIDQIKK